MSRRRQRSAAYRARRWKRQRGKMRWLKLFGGSMQRLSEEDVQPYLAGPYWQHIQDEMVRVSHEAMLNTIAYANWLDPQVAKGAVMDELAKLTPDTEEDIKARFCARIEALAAAQAKTMECPACHQTFIHATNCPVASP